MASAVGEKHNIPLVGDVYIYRGTVTACEDVAPWKIGGTPRAKVTIAAPLDVGTVSATDTGYATTHKAPLGSPAKFAIAPGRKTLAAGIPGVLLKAPEEKKYWFEKALQSEGINKFVKEKYLPFRVPRSVLDDFLFKYVCKKEYGDKYSIRASAAILLIVFLFTYMMLLPALTSEVFNIPMQTSFAIYIGIFIATFFPFCLFDILYTSRNRRKIKELENKSGKIADEVIQRLSDLVTQ